MGIHIDSYAKDPDSIVGQIRCLGYYEVRLNAIEKHKLNKSSVEFYGDIFSITELGRIGSGLVEYGLSPVSFIFYDLAPCYISGQSLGKYDGETVALMFEPNTLIYAITQLVEVHGQIIKNFSDFVQEMIKEREEFEKLKEFKALLELAIENNGMIGIIVE